MADADTKLEDRALSLPPSQRLRLARRLLSSVGGAAMPYLSEDDATALALERADELDSGVAESLDYRQEMDRIRNSLRR